MSKKQPCQKLLITHGRVINPATGMNRIADVLIEDGTVRRVAPRIRASRKGMRILNARNKWVIPGVIDMHVHLREPGREDQETIHTGTRAAALSGTTQVVCMANTQPPVDNISEIIFILSKAASEGMVKVRPVGAITKELKGKELAEIGIMAANGAVAISDDGFGIMDAGLFKKVMAYSKEFNILIIDHAEDHSISKGGVMNHGLTAHVMGLKGIPRQAEYAMVFRDISLAEQTGARLHLAHVSTAESVHIIRQAKLRGVKITAETCPHYFSLTEEAVKDYNTNAKVNPPLRTARDIAAIIEGLQDGTIDVIASDHAPHTYAEKAQEFDRAPCGMIGIETLLPLTITQLVKRKKLTPLKAVTKLTTGPAGALGFSRYGIIPGAAADLAIIDPDEERVFDHSASKSRNSPFLGWKLSGFASATIIDGRIVMERGRLVLP
ncbi:MAG: amidohydrolase family protein [Elusimicrobia bacterium]|nr:amidohydrolase family protein [Elusimicrobiota bacterium]MBD3412769.1 amidohydrolase family protein [Elusimicrobiota bacterium]